MYTFSSRSLKNLQSCDRDLQRLFLEVIKYWDCTILCGYRDEQAQNIAYREGKSKAKWGQSKHNTNPSDAVDVMPYPIKWDDTTGLYHFAGFVKATAIQLDIDIKWGGDFTSFFDGPHWEINND